MRRAATNAAHYLARCMSTQAARRSCHPRGTAVGGWRAAGAPRVFARALLLIIAPVIVAQAGLLEGSVTFPGRTVPVATVYARNVDSGLLHEILIDGNEKTFRMEVPAGRYWVFIRPQEPGLAEIYGAHTRFTVCRGKAGEVSAATCTDHTLHAVEVPEAGAVSGVSIDDWFLEDSQAQELDRILGIAGTAPDTSELGRPRFSEYRTAVAATDAAEKPAFLADPRAAPFLAQLVEAASAGPNFAGAFRLVRLDCGAGCRQVALVEVASGVAHFPDQLARLGGGLACRDDRALGFREDSRLLEYTHLQDEVVVTDYLLWNAEQQSFSALAQYRRSLDRYCTGTPAATQARPR